MPRHALVFILSMFLAVDGSGQSSPFARGRLDDALDSCVFIMLATFIIAMYAIARLARKNLRRKSQLAETELELKALRARMDPHFIFNSLNAINRFIIRNDTKTAADYLTRFARLMRLVLESSASPFIILSEEFDILNNYLALENGRFDYPFTWKISHPGIDPSSVQIPTLLIQPFVENAIWHGLHHLPSGGGEILIHFQLHDNILRCEILDNGVGRKKAAQLKETSSADQSIQQPFPKTSLGIALSIQRLERFADFLPGRSSEHALGVLFEDLKEDAEHDGGTREIVYCAEPDCFDRIFFMCSREDDIKIYIGNFLQQLESILFRHLHVQKDQLRLEVTDHLDGLICIVRNGQNVNFGAIVLQKPLQIFAAVPLVIYNKGLCHFPFLSGSFHGYRQDLVKPIDKDELCVAVGNCANRSRADSARQVNAMLSHLQKNSDWAFQKAAFPTQSGYELLMIKDIMFCEGSSNYTNVHLQQGRHLLVSKTLKEIADMLDFPPFFRVHHSFLINLHFVVRYIKGEGGFVVMGNEMSIPVSRNKKEELLGIITNLSP